MKYITYDGNEKETYDLLVNNNVVAEILTGEDGAINIVREVKEFINENSYMDKHIVIQNDDEKLGIIVDIYDEKGDEHLNTMTIWFEDYHE